MSKISSKSTNKYSTLQYFFWLLSGAEISILKECPTDYNRQAGIGFTIFMTTLLAFCSGSYAGYYFGESYVSAVIFGTIWASLIFSIDRSMVVTLKKDPTKKHQNFLIAFLSRAVLAILIAFIISIPLELLIFKENIDIHKPKFKQDKILNIKWTQSEIEGMDNLNGQKQNIDNKIKANEAEQKQTEPKNDPSYDNLKSNWLTQQNIYNNLLAKKNNADNIARHAYNSVPNNQFGNKDVFSPQWSTYQNRKANANRAKSTFNAFNHTQLKQLENNKNNYIKNWKTNLAKKIINLNSLKAVNDTKVNRGQNKVDEAKLTMDTLLKKHDNSFVFNFMVLEDLARTHKKVLKPVKNEFNRSRTITKDPDSADVITPITQIENAVNTLEKEWVYEYDHEGATIFFLLWLIRILFFTIEILPTIAKIATPIGAYDRAIYRKEKDLELEMEQRTVDYLAHQKHLRDIENETEKQQVEERNRIEKELHQKVLEGIATAQNQIAMQKIEEFINKNSPTS